MLDTYRKTGSIFKIQFLPLRLVDGVVEVVSDQGQQIQFPFFDSLKKVQTKFHFRFSVLFPGEEASLILIK